MGMGETRWETGRRLRTTELDRHHPAAASPRRADLAQFPLGSATVARCPLKAPRHRPFSPSGADAPTSTARPRAWWTLRRGPASPDRTDLGDLHTSARAHAIRRVGFPCSWP